ncbi:sigma E protease regulator RseP [Aliamphritea ceti]|uniref:sigma E protease regulator RseP n=1 Tax=Aliamphritea ceti TaxID=1524258 RepID=UPI0021C39383|nr:sigma E protease regulator RseP [Aliamphritea ceti]
MEFFTTILAMLVTLGILVTIHEYGHFWVARRCGIKVIRFSVGFGRPLVRWRDKQDTEYVIAAIPLGGYVSMLDEREADVPENLKSQAFNRKTVYQRFAVVAAGPLVNLIFPVFIYWALFLSGTNEVVPVIGAVKSDSIAEVAGIRPGGEVIAVDGYNTPTWDDINLRLAARIGDEAIIPVEIRYEAQLNSKIYNLNLQNWQFDLETESPLHSVGIDAFRPAVPVIIGRVESAGQAELSGLKIGDEILSANGKPVGQWESFVAFIQKNAGRELELEILRNGQSMLLSIIPAEKRWDNGEITGYIGAGVQPVEWPENMRRVVQYGVFESAEHAIRKTWQMITLTLDSIWKMLEGILSVKNLSGPITIAKVAAASAASGIETFASFLAYLSISLGILNLLPIPMLDGGHLVYYCVEMIRGRPVSEKIQAIGLRLGMAVLFTLMGVAIFNDLMRL